MSSEEGGVGTLSSSSGVSRRERSTAGARRACGRADFAGEVAAGRVRLAGAGFARLALDARRLLPAAARFGAAVFFFRPPAGLAARRLAADRAGFAGVLADFLPAAGRALAVRPVFAARRAAPRFGAAAFFRAGFLAISD
jgi:hypothetical protein